MQKRVVKVHTKEKSDENVTIIRLKKTQQTIKAPNLALLEEQDPLVRTKYCKEFNL